MNAVTLDDDISDDTAHILSMLIGDEEKVWRDTRVQAHLINQLVLEKETPADILKKYFKWRTNTIPHHQMKLRSLVIKLIMEGQLREPIPNINTFELACDLIRNRRNIIVLTGAGISVSCGIPDFRSRNGIYARLATDFPDLEEPESIFDIDYFVKNPRPFFQFAKEIYPGKFTPSIGHRFIKLLEEKGKLLRNYTQNIDTLESVADIKNTVHCHGSFSTATCMLCGYKTDGFNIEDDIMHKRIPICPQCSEGDEENFEEMINGNLESTHAKLPIMKPDIVFFGEALSKHFHETMAKDKHNVDLLIVIGSSLKVRPVAHIPGSLPSNVPQILINREPLGGHRFDIELLGDCDTIIEELCRELNWQELASKTSGEITQKTVFEIQTKAEREEFKSKGCIKDRVRLVSVADMLSDDITCIRVPPNRYVFKGAQYVIKAGDLDNSDTEDIRHVSLYSSDSDSDD